MSLLLSLFEGLLFFLGFLLFFMDYYYYVFSLRHKSAQQISDSCWGRRNKFTKNGLRIASNQFDTGLMLHEKMTHPIITNNQFYRNRIFDPTFQISILHLKQQLRTLQSYYCLFPYTESLNIYILKAHI